MSKNTHNTKRRMGGKFLFLSILAALSFGVASATALEINPMIRTEIIDNQLVLTFTGNLEESTDCVNWTAIDAASPYTVGFSDVKKFFRASGEGFGMTVVTNGNIAVDDLANFRAKGVDLVAQKTENLFKFRNALLRNLSEIQGDDAAAVRKMFDAPGVATVSLYEPTLEEVTALKKLLGVERSAPILADDLGINSDNDKQLRFYSVGKDKKGNIYGYAGVQQGLDSQYQIVRNDSIRKEDVDAGYVWVVYNDKNDTETPYDVITYELEEVQNADGNYYNISQKNVIGKVAESAIVIGENEPEMTVDLGGNVYKALFVQKEKYSYNLVRSGIEIPEEEETAIETLEIPVTDEEKKAAGELTDAEKIAQTRKCDIEGFIAWLKEHRSNILQSSDRELEPASNDDNVPDIFDVAWKEFGTVGTSFKKLPGLSISTTITIAAAHHFDDVSNPEGGNDFYYVKQSCVMNNGISESYKRHWYQGGNYDPVKLIQVFEDRNVRYWVGGAECDEFSFSHYGVTTKLKESLTYPNINCIKARPEAYNNVTTVTVSHEHSVGASAHAGVSDGKVDAGGSLRYGYTSGKSESYETHDIESKLYNNHNCITWNYDSTKIPHRDSLWTKLTYPADLTVSTYQPAQYFIWQMPTSQRGAYTGLQNTLSVTVEGVYSRNSGSLSEQHCSGTVTATDTVQLPKPPLFCLDKETVNFDESTTKTDYIIVYSQGDWAWDESTVPDWLTLIYTPGNFQLTIEAQPNTTGKVRTAEIKLQRGDGSEAWDKRTVTVTQSQYSK